MRKSILAASVAGALGVGLFTVSASASPVSAPASGPAAVEQSGVEKAHWRWRRGPRFGLYIGPAWGYGWGRPYYYGGWGRPYWAYGYRPYWRRHHWHRRHWYRRW
jgi:hypothetical protein